MTAGVLAGVHSLRIGDAAKTLSRAALALVYAVLTGSVIYAIIGPAVMAGQAGIALAVLNMILFYVPLAFLLCSGMVKWISAVAGRPGQAFRANTGGMMSPAMVPAPVPTGMAGPAASGALGSALESRLQSLATLRERGVISEQEYAIKRARILEDM